MQAPVPALGGHGGRPYIGSEGVPPSREEIEGGTPSLQVPPLRRGDRRVALGVPPPPILPRLSLGQGAPKRFAPTRILL
jgi:hypothetical protein